MTIERKHVKTPPAQLQAAKEEDDEVIDDSHNWRGIGISLLVILGICSVIALAILLLTPRSSGSNLRGNRIRLSDIIDGDFVPRRFNGSWISDDHLEYRDKYGHLIVYSLRYRTTRRLLENTTFADYGIQKYSISADHNYVLLLHDIVKLYRYSFKAKYKIYDINNKTIYSLEPPDDPSGFIQYASWGPVGSQLVYVYSNNVYYVEKVNDAHHALTTNGVEGVIFNGIPDWLYEHEILETNGAVWWSPSGNFLCYATFNDSKVGTFYYNWYGGTNQNESQAIYPELMSLRYPRPGKDNPSAFLWVVDIRNTGKFLLRDVKPPREVQDQLVHVWDHYFTSVQWRDNVTLAVIWMTRSQNYSVVTQCTGALWYCGVVYEQRPSSGRGWVDLYGPIFFGQDKRSWYLKAPLSEGRHGYYQHVAVAYNDSRHLDYLSQGRYDVRKIIAYNEASDTLYYLSSIENRPGERHLFSVSGKKIRFITFTKCLTCDEGYHCLYVNAIFSHKAEFYVLECLGPGVPRIEIKSVYNETLAVLDSNDEVRAKVEKLSLPQIRTFQVPINEEYNAQVRLLLPPGVADDEVALYPLVVFADGSPGSQLVTSEFTVDWGTYLSGRRNCIYAWIDGRGSSAQGDKMRQEIYTRLGTVEVEDQIEVTRYLRDNLPFIHPSHIAIWGWSYGGFVAATALSADNTVFKCAASVAPITNWLLYDTAFTERYMGTTDRSVNYWEYSKSSLMNKAHKMRGKRLLLIHGTADDKVHFQHSIMLMKAMIENGVLFQTQIYPDEDNSLANVTSHLYRTIEDFLNECFYIKRKDEYENTPVQKDQHGR